MRPFLIAGMLLASALLTKNAEAQPLRVLVRVDAANITLHDRLDSEIRRELRRLGDVVVVDRGHDFTLEVVALVTSNQGGAATGHAISAVFLDHTALNLLVTQNMVYELRALLSEEDSVRLDENFDLIVTNLIIAGGNHHLHRGHHLLTGSDQSLTSNVRDLIASFDTDALEPARLQRASPHRY